ncbi:MAG: hypothetical protein GY749_11335 [Desulfobacteraceae bacterium]|nr:hypothetical protein [Desulfobacteraceae bacterium]
MIGAAFEEVLTQERTDRNINNPNHELSVLRRIILREKITEGRISVSESAAVFALIPVKGVSSAVFLKFEESISAYAATREICLKKKFSRYYLVWDLFVFKNSLDINTACYITIVIL